jgi:ABC-type multidrug transport system permease subunit
MITSVIIPINFLLLFLLFALTGGQAPTAIVLEDKGPYAQQFLSAMEHSHSFIIQQTTSVDAQNLMKKGQVVAIVTVPDNFDSLLRQGNQVQLRVVLNNLNVDFTNDIRRAVPLAITSFYANAFPNQVVIRAHEVDSYSHDTGYVQYLVVSLMVVSVMLGGLLQAGSNAAREYEKGTIKELMLAPISKTTLIAGKLLSGWITTLLIASVVLVVGAASGYLRPEGTIYWISTLVIVLLIALASAGLGVAIGAASRRFQRVTAIGIPLSIDLFFLSGGITVAAFLPAWLQTIAHFVPTFYGTHALQMAIFYGSTEGLALIYLY